MRRCNPMPEHWPSASCAYDGDDLKRLRNYQRRVNRARKFMVNTCPASRHLHMIADALAAKHPYWMLLEEPQHIAETMYSVLEQLWKLRTSKAEGLNAGPPSEASTTPSPPSKGGDKMPSRKRPT